MRREAKLLQKKACDSLLLGIELFNRPNDRGRVSGVLIQIDHGFEMLLKAAIVHRGGKVRDKDAKQTIGFDTCVRRGLSDGGIKFLTEEQALTLQIINSLRDAAQHHLLEISEDQLYLHIQAGVTLFQDLLRSVFGKELSSELPKRVLPVSTSLPSDLVTIFSSEVSEVLKLLAPGRRRRIEAQARLRPLAILDSAVVGERDQPSAEQLNRISKELGRRPWTRVFTGAAAIEVVTEGNGPTLSIRLTKREGPPLQIVPEGTPGAYTVGVRRVNELSYYNLGAKDLAEKLGLSLPKTVAVVDHSGMREDPDCYKEFRIGSSFHKRYSQKAIGKIRAVLETEHVDDIWNKQKDLRRRAGRNGSSVDPNVGPP